MPGITLDVADQRLQEYMRAESVVLGGQSFDFADGRKLTQADLSAIRSGIAYWSDWVDRLNPVQRQAPAPRPVGRVRRGGYRMR